MRQFNHQELLNYAAMCQLAYFNQDTLLKNVSALVPRGWKYRDNFQDQQPKPAPESSFGSVVESYESVINMFSPYNVRVYVFINEANKELVFAIKGTVPTDIATLYQDSYIATGNFLPLPPKLSSFVSKVRETYPKFKHTLVGHSLGGYLASRTFMDAHHRGQPFANAYVFDAPGVESHLLPNIANAKLEIHNFVGMPNLVNCAGYHPGNVYHLPMTSAELRHYSPQFNQIAAQSGGLVYLLGHYVLKPVTAYIVSKTTPITSDQATSLIDCAIKGVQAVTKEIKGILDKPDIAKLQLPDKLTHTLRTHNISGFVNIIFTQGEQLECKPIDKKQFPSAEKFITAKDVNALKFVYLPDAKAVDPTATVGPTATAAPTLPVNKKSASAPIPMPHLLQMVLNYPMYSAAALLLLIASATIDLKLAVALSAIATAGYLYHYNAQMTATKTLTPTR